MEEVSAKWIEAEAIIQQFKADFAKKFNAEVYITYRELPNIVNEPRIPMEYILEDINMFLLEDYPDGIAYNDHYNKTIIDLSKDGIRTKCRIPGIINYRYMFYRICSQLGYNNCQISRFIKGSMDHSIVIHGCRTIQNRLDIKDQEVLRIHRKIIPYLNSKYKLKLK